jgi:hypothetical protein
MSTKDHFLFQDDKVVVPIDKNSASPIKHEPAIPNLKKGVTTCGVAFIKHPTIKEENKMMIGKDHHVYNHVHQQNLSLPSVGKTRNEFRKNSTIGSI